jgi:hypothetical protein
MNPKNKLHYALGKRLHLETAYYNEVQNARFEIVAAG